MRTNYPKEYLERCQADMASKAGAVAIANAIEAELAAFAKAALKGRLEILEEEKDTGEEEKAAAAAVVADGRGGDTSNGIEESKGGEEESGAGTQLPAAG